MGPLPGHLTGCRLTTEEVRDLLIHDGGDVECRAVGVAEAQPIQIRHVALALAWMYADGLMD